MIAARNGLIVGGGQCSSCYKDTDYISGSKQCRRCHEGGTRRRLARRARRTGLTPIRAAIVSGYGGRCQCCGEARPEFLDLDHVFDDGKTQRGRHGGTYNEWRWLLKNGFPRDRHQLLCSNCNQGKRRNGGVCPHIGKPGYPVAGARYPRAASADSTKNLVDQSHPTS